MEPNEELIDSLASKYAEKYAERFQKIAKQAYIDGIMKVLNEFLKG